jgi:hypothetical protein
VPVLGHKKTPAMVFGRSFERNELTILPPASVSAGVISTEVRLKGELHHHSLIWYPARIHIESSVSSFFPHPQINCPISSPYVSASSREGILITGKASDASRKSRSGRGRHGATTEAYETIRRKETRPKTTRLELCEIPSWREDDALMVIRGAINRLTIRRLCHTFYTLQR